MERREPSDSWWVYMIACRGEKVYTGTARYPEARFRAHAAGKGAAFTRANPPEELLRCERYPNRQAACRAEAELKKLTREKNLLWAKRDS